MPFKKHSCLLCSPAIIFYKNFLQHFISKALILCKVVFPSVHVSQPYMQLRGKHMFCEFLVLLEDPDHSARISTSTACLLLQQAFSLFPPTHLHLQILWIPDKHICTNFIVPRKYADFNFFFIKFFFVYFLGGGGGGILTLCWYKHQVVWCAACC